MCLAEVAQAAALPMENQPWVRVDNAGFVVLSNAGPTDAVRVSQDVEALRRALGAVTRLDLSSPVPTWIYLFATDRSMIPYKHRYQGEPASISGAFYSRPYGDYIVMNGSRRGEAKLTIYHELVHGVLRNNLPGLPLWLEEGLAEFFSTFYVVDGARTDGQAGTGQLAGTRGVIGKPLKRHLRELAQGEPLSLEELLGIDSQSPHYNVFQHQGEMYARSWELVHYLLLGNDQRRRQMLDFLKLGFQGIDQDEAFARAFDVDYQTLDKELAAYREQGFKPQHIELQPVKANGLKLRSVSYPQILVHLGDLLVGQGDRDQAALLHFEEALRRDSAHGGAMAGLGLVAQHNRDYAKARALFQRAVVMAPRDARLHYHYGSSLLLLGRGTSEKNLRQARSHLRRCLELMPEFAPAWARLAEAYGLGRRVDDEAVKTGQTAYRLLPSRPQVALQLLLLYSRTQSKAEARRLYLDYFAHHTDGEVKQNAEDILKRMDWLSADSRAPTIDIVN